MPADADMVSLYCLRYTIAQLEAFLDAALEAARESITISRSCEGSSMTISAENAKQVVLDLGAALTSKRAAAAAPPAPSMENGEGDGGTPPLQQRQREPIDRV